MVIMVKLGAQSYSFRKFSYEKAVEMVASLNLNYIEAFPGHLPPEEKNIELSKKLEKEYGVKLIAHGVNLMPADEKTLRNLFEFAYKAGIEVLTADPEPDAFNLLDKLVEEYDIAVAIHNHGPGHRYATAEEVLKAVENHHKLIGMCMDTGHLVRAEKDPVKAVEILGDRLHSIHLKDVGEDKHDTVLGEGIIDFENFFKKLKESNLLTRIPIVIEYELEPENPLPGIRKSLNYILKYLK